MLKKRIMKLLRSMLVGLLFTIGLITLLTLPFICYEFYGLLGSVFCLIFYVFIIATIEFYND